MSGLPEEQLLELLLHLKRSSPGDARTILNSQPQISYALIALMVKMNAIDVEVVQKTVASYGNAAAPAPPPAPVAAAVPPHMAPQYNRTPTPQGRGAPPPQAAPPPRYPPHPNGHTAPAGYANQYAPRPSVPPQAQAPPAAAAALLANIPDDQKALVMQMLAMSPAEVNQLPPAARSNVLQLRASLGIPS
ncbi:hypothetical protein PLICRDRAFT_35253 [Plicaturopsis crispa FD-325 SS-3]|nr:hypothetical protein PLICRDRAFT_35253 [Plicaturopsis crispa FD-325 SS-3]